jgi:hypothetical protein
VLVYQRKSQSTQLSSLLQNLYLFLQFHTCFDLRGH